MKRVLVYQCMNELWSINKSETNVNGREADGTMSEGAMSDKGTFFLGRLGFKKSMQSTNANASTIAWFAMKIFVLSCLVLALVMATEKVLATKALMSKMQFNFLHAQQYKSNHSFLWTIFTRIFLQWRHWNLPFSQRWSVQLSHHHGECQCCQKAPY